MQTLGDVVQVGLAILSVYVFVRVLWRAWVRPFFPGDDRSVVPPRQAVPPRARWSIRDELARLFLIMSNDEDEDRAYPVVVLPVAAPSTETWQPIAMPGNADNDRVPGNDLADLIPAEARDIIRMQAKAEAVALLLKSAKMTNKAEAIELIFNCSRSGRPNSTYQQALVLVDPLIERYPQRTPEQERLREQLKLN